MRASVWQAGHVLERRCLAAKRAPEVRIADLIGQIDQVRVWRKGLDDAPIVAHAVPLWTLRSVPNHLWSGEKGRGQLECLEADDAPFHPLLKC